MFTGTAGLECWRVGNIFQPSTGAFGLLAVQSLKRSLEDWRAGKLEAVDGWKAGGCGRLEGWKAGRLEGWKAVGGLEG